MPVISCVEVESLAEPSELWHSAVAPLLPAFFHGDYGEEGPDLTSARQFGMNVAVMGISLRKRTLNRAAVICVDRRLTNKPAVKRARLLRPLQGLGIVKLGQGDAVCAVEPVGGHRLLPPCGGKQSAYPCPLRRASFPQTFRKSLAEDTPAYALISVDPRALHGS